jgi:hypothetical protein
MKYKFVEAYRVKGLVGPSKIKSLINEPRFSAFLIENPNDILTEVDKRTAIANLILDGLVSGRPEGKLDDFINSQIVEIKSERIKKGANGYLIIEITGEIEEYKPSVEREHEGVHIAFDVVDKDEIRAEFSDRIKNIITALTLVSNKIIGIEKDAEGILLYKNETSIIFPFTPKGSVASIYISSPLTDEMIDNVTLLFNRLNNHKELERVAELLVSSLKSTNELLRAFLSSWTALEIFVNKTFRIFEKKFFAELKTGQHPDTREKYLDRIRSVMEGKYTLVDKFSVLSLSLSPSNTDSDVNRFEIIKKQRDRLTHGEIIPDSELEIKNTKQLLTEYLRLYLNSLKTV